MAASKNTEVISIECVDNCSGSPGVVVYDDATFPIPIHQPATQRPVCSDGSYSYGPHSSVRVFQLDRYGPNTRMPWAPPLTVRDSNPSNVGPPHSSNDEEVPMEVD